MIKFLLRTFVALIVLAAVAAGLAYVYLDRVAQGAIERGGRYALGVPTRVGSVGIDLAGGRIHIAGLEIANPPGFEDPYFVHLDAGALHLPLQNLTQDVVHVPLLAFDGVEVNIARLKSGSNYGAILDHLERLSSGGQSRATERAGKKFVVDELRVTGIEARLRQEVIAGQKAVVEVEVPKIQLRNIGSESGGVVLSELTGILTRSILDAIVRTGGVPKAILGDLTTSLSSLGKLDVELPQGVGEAAEAAGTITRELGGKTGKQIGEALKGIGGLLGKSKRQRND